MILLIFEAIVIALYFVLFFVVLYCAVLYIVQRSVANCLS